MPILGEGAAVERQKPQHVVATALHAENSMSYSAFTTWQKRWIVFIAAFAAWFSTASSFLFFPIIDSLAEELDVSTQRIDLTVTSYLIVAGLAPVFTAGISDTIGRRPAFLISFAIFLAANIGLSVQKSFAALFVLRMVQSAGVAGTFAIAYGVLSDVATPAERGSYVGYVAFCTNLAPSLGPVIAASLNSSLGWRSVFYFLITCSGLWLLVIFLSMPETLRLLVGDGSLLVKGIAYNAVLPGMRPRKPGTYNIDAPSSRRTSSDPVKTNPTLVRNIVSILSEKDKTLVILAISILYTVWNCLQVSLATLCIHTYNLTYLQAGLVYIPFGVGVGFAGFFTGLLLDRDYREIARKHKLPISRGRGDNLINFPIEEARFRSTPLPLLVVCVCLISYGWCIRFRVHLASILVLQFCLGASLQVCFTTLNTLLIDLDQQKAAMAQAVSNFSRCLLAAGAVALLQIVLGTVREGWTFTIIAALASLCFGIIIAERKCGQRWRAAREPSGQ